MPSYSGKFQYLNADGSAAQAGTCQVTFDESTLTLAPTAGAPLAFDLGDIDLFQPGDFELTLTLYTGKKILLNQFGKALQNLGHDLLEAYRQRLVQCLLLEDLEETSRFDGFAQLSSPVLPARSFSSPAEFRLYRSNLAVLPTLATGFQWRLADIDALKFDETNYAVVLESGGERLTVTKLAKRTREFRERLENSVAQLNQHTANTLHEIFPFLNPDQLQQAALLMREGHAAPLAGLKAIHPKTEQALVGNVIDAKLKPYFDALMKHVPPGWGYAGFKLIREEEEPGETEAELPVEEPVTASAGANEEPQEEAPEEPAREAPEEETERQPILYWFFFPLATKPGARFPGNLVAWEATSKGGRATYFFRLLPREQARVLADPSQAPAAVDAAIRQLNRALVLLNFRREPVYLPEDSLEMQPRFRRYAIACRKIPELRRLRASFLGRAIHTSPQAWNKQLEAFLAKAEV
jgi:hypothetical protein